MRKRFLSLIASVAFSTMLSSVCFANIVNYGLDYPDIVYTDEWKEMGLGEKREACHLDAKEVAALSDEEVIELARNYPLVMCYNGFDTWEMGQKYLLEDSEAFAELVRREDIEPKLISVLENDEFFYYQNEDSEARVQLKSWGITVSELLLSSWKKGKLSQEEKDSLIAVVRGMYNSDNYERRDFAFRFKEKFDTFAKNEVDLSEIKREGIGENLTIVPDTGNANGMMHLESTYTFCGMKAQVRAFDSCKSIVLGEISALEKRIVPHLRALYINVIELFV